jgi:outer membrane autotransporter protein
LPSSRSIAISQWVFATVVFLATTVPAAPTVAQVPFTFTADDTPLPIPPGAPDESFGTTISQILSIETLPGAVSDLDVFVDLDHTFTGDLDLYVEHDGTEVHLFNQFGLAGSDIQDVLFDDEAATPISAGTPPFGPGSFQPDPGVLADLDGAALSGDWTLRVVDSFVGDTGELFVFRIQGTVDPFLIPAQSNPVAEAAGIALNSIIPGEFFDPDPAFAQIVTYLAGADEDEQELALRGLAQDEAFAAADLSLRQLGWHHRSVRDRLRATRGAGMGMGPTEIAGVASRGPVQVASLTNTLGAAAPQPDSEPSRFGVWLAGRGSFGERDTSSRAAGYDFAGGSGAAGADVRIAERFLAGVSVGGGAINADFDGTGGDLDSNTIFATLYGQARPVERLYLDLMGSYAWSGFDSRRRVVAGDFAASPAGDFNGRTFGFDGQAFYEFGWEQATFGPALAISYLDARVDSYGESGGDVADLRIGSDDAQSLQTWLGGEAYGDFGASESIRIFPHLFVYWVHEYLDDVRTVSGSFREFPAGAPMLLRSDSPDRDYMELAAGLGFAFGERTRAWLRYETTLLRRDWTENQVTAGLAVRF